jgi:Leu/Phe-tRNA-protein transferase
VGGNVVLRIKHVLHVRTRFAIVQYPDRQQPFRIDVDRNFKRLTRRAATNRPRNEVEKRLSQLSLIGDDG